MLRRWMSFVWVGLLAACTTVPTTPPAPGTASGTAGSGGAVLAGSEQAFAQVVRRVEPVAEQECRRQTSGVDCNFRIVVDSRPGIPANAFQTLDDNGRPVIVFTKALLDDARNVDELAFVLGHEAAHHIEGHIQQQRENARLGAVVFAGLATATGGTNEDIRRAEQIGAAVGARTYSKDFELEADALGTVIAARAGYSPIRGAEFFNRIPDPGDRFLGTHPPNAQRLATVRRVAAGL